MFRGTSSNPREVPFRRAFAEIGKLRSFFQKPFLCLTATANKKTRRGIRKMLFLKQVKLINKSPENLYTKVSVTRTKYYIEETFHDLVNQLKTNKYEHNKTIIFCRSIDKCAAVYSEFNCALKALFPPNSLPCAMYHSKTIDRIKQQVQTEFSKLDSKIRVVVGT